MEKKIYFEELSNDELLEFSGGHHGFAYHLGELVGGVIGVVAKVGEYVGLIQGLKK
jgi:hypothetical protein